MNESVALADYVVHTDYSDIPDQVADVTKRSLLDSLGVMMAGSGLGEGCRQFVDLAIAGGGKQESTIIGTDRRVPSYMAAFANGSMSHALDFENTFIIHPYAAAIVAALALGESIGNVSGRKLIAAITVGSDVVCRLALASRRDVIQPGSELGSGRSEPSPWYIPSIYGTFGATAASCNLLGLRPDQTLDAFSLAMCQSTCSGELIYSPRSLVRAIRDAFAAKAGVISALLAQKGIVGFEQPIEGKAGFYAMYAKGNYDRQVLTNDLGRVFQSANVSFKAWPSCYGTHPYAAATLQIVGEHDLKPSEIESIRFVLLGPNTMLCEPLESKRKPKTAIDAKFSIPFVIASALVQKNVTLGSFALAALQDPDVLQVAGRITYEVGTSPRGEGEAVPQGLVQIKTKYGEIQSRKIEFIYGHPANPMSQPAIIAKFKDCAAYSPRIIPEKNLERIVQLILHLEDVDNVGEIMACL